MSGTLSQEVLVLNKSWAAIGVVSMQRAITMLFSENHDGKPKAKIVEPSSYATFTWDDWSKIKPLATDEVIRSANLAFRCPEVIQLTSYDKLSIPKSNFSRRNLFKRDKYRCQYCNCHPGTTELTVEHVIPKSRGGETSWTNCTTACVECNSRKANRTPEEAGMKLIKEPKKPVGMLFRPTSAKQIKSFSQFVSDCYWNVELID